jgi:hypothetical protein
VPTNATLPAVRRRVAAALVCLSTTGALACTPVVADSSACRNLVYTDGGVARAAYVPCAGEMIAGLEELDRQTKAALGGDRQARSEGQATVGRVMALMKAAGGMRLLDRWNDKSLTELNLNIHNAVTHYQAFYMVPILTDPDPYAEQSRQSAQHEFDRGNRRYTNASRLFRLIK